MSIFQIRGGGTYFTQHDTGQQLIVLDDTCDTVYYHNSSGARTYRRDISLDGDIRVVDVPDELLADTRNITAYAYVTDDGGNLTTQASVFEVRARSGGGEVLVQNAVLYTAQSLTEDEQAQARSNIGAVADDYVLWALPIYAGEVDNA